MKQMRRKDRQITDTASLLAILTEAKVCHLAMVDDEGAYLVPLNFGYSFTPVPEPSASPCCAAAETGDRSASTHGLDGTLTLYFHSASTGRKIDALRQNPRVCFSVDGAHALIETPMMTDYTYHYHSLIGSGKAQFITDPAARMDAMVALMRQQTGLPDAEIRNMPRDERWMQADVMTVIAVTVEELAGKRHG